MNPLLTKIEKLLQERNKQPNTSMKEILKDMSFQILMDAGLYEIHCVVGVLWHWLHWLVLTSKIFYYNSLLNVLIYYVWVYLSLLFFFSSTFLRWYQTDIEWISSLDLLHVLHFPKELRLLWTGIPQLITRQISDGWRTQKISWSHSVIHPTYTTTMTHRYYD